MAGKLDAERVMSGTFGELWLDGEYMAEVLAFEASIEIETEEVPQAGLYTTDQKYMGHKGSGTMRLHKMSSRVAKKVSDSLKKGILPRMQMLSSLNDPAAWGAERVLVKDARINKISLANWELKKKGEEEFPFTFTDWEFKDAVNAG
ncbi:MAG: phage tail tube protein [Clostridiales bacterium]|jgi:hypothetical protein|nr:phage tail tube protein [Clostridiales bacterium]